MNADRLAIAWRWSLHHGYMAIGFVLRNASPFPRFYPMHGKPGLFKADW